MLARLLTLPLALAPLLAACQSHPEYPNVDSGIALFNRGMGSPDLVLWMDNDRAVFVGRGYLDKRDAEGRRMRDEISLYVWNTRTNTATKHIALKTEQINLCVDNNFIAYRASDFVTRKPHLFRAGEFGKEKTYSPAKTDWKDVPEVMRCVEKSPHKVREGHPEITHANVVQLRPEHGFLEIHEDGNGRLLTPTEHQFAPVKFHIPGRKEPVLLPIRSNELGTGFGSDFQYAEFAKRYVVQTLAWPGFEKTKSGERRPLNQPYSVYLLALDGTVDAITYPHRMGGGSFTFLTRKGLFWATNDAPSGNSREAGGWLRDDEGNFVKLYDHINKGVGVSPDGCKIVYATNDYSDNNPVNQHLRLIDLCKSSGGLRGQVLQQRVAPPP